jgi:hypothetical protein
MNPSQNLKARCQEHRALSFDEGEAGSLRFSARAEKRRETIEKHGKF